MPLARWISKLESLTVHWVTTQLERSPSGTRADINRGARGEFVYLCVSKDTASSKPPVSDIIAIFPERGEFVPTDYEYVTRRGVPANLNTVRVLVVSDGHQV